MAVASSCVLLAAAAATRLHLGQPAPGCVWKEVQHSIIFIWAHGFDVRHPPYDATNLQAAQAWCCARGPACAGITFHGGGPSPTQHFDAMGRCGTVHVNFTNTTSWQKDPCHGAPRPPAPPAPPLPPPPAVPSDTPRLEFDPASADWAGDSDVPQLWARYHTQHQRSADCVWHDRLRIRC